MTAARRRFSFWAGMRAARQRLAALDSSIVATPYGAAEYADRGSGPPVLVIHGVMGGVDAGLRNVACHVPDGYRIIVPSRFGYLHSTLPPRAAPALQADTYAALLDTLDVDRVAVIAASAGATSACSSRSATPTAGRSPRPPVVETSMSSGRRHSPPSRDTVCAQTSRA